MIIRFFNILKILFPALVVAVLLSNNLQLILPLILLTAGVFLIVIDEKILIILIIACYLLITSEFYEEYRLIVVLFSTASLVILCIKRLGFDFRNYIRIPKELTFFLILLFLTLMISTIYSHNPFASIIAVSKMLFFLILCYLFYSLLKDEKNILVYIYSLITVMIVFGIRMLLDLWNLGIKNYFMRILIADESELFGSLGYTGLTIFFISISFIISLIYINRKNKKKKYFFIALLIFNSLVLILANSRGGIVAAIISVSFFLLMLKRKAFLKWSFALIGIFIILLTYSPSINEIFFTYLRLETNSSRNAYWQTGIEIVKDYPLTGTGANLFDTYFYSYSPRITINILNSPLFSDGKPHPHNLFIYFTAENGILGLVTSVSFFFMFFYLSYKTLKATKKISHHYHTLIISITGIGLGLLFLSFFEISGYLHYGYINRDLPFWISFAILIAVYNKFNVNERQTVI